VKHKVALSFLSCLYLEDVDDFRITVLDNDSLPKEKIIRQKFGVQMGAFWFQTIPEAPTTTAPIRRRAT